MGTIPFDPTVEDAVDRLAAEFAGIVSAAVVRRNVMQARRELTGEPAAALPELIERLARARIIEALEQGPSVTPGRRPSSPSRHRRTT